MTLDGMAVNDAIAVYYEHHHPYDKVHSALI